MAVGAVALLIVFGAIAAIQLNTRTDYRTNGPLAVTDETRITYELGVGQSTTWGMPLEGVLGKVVVLDVVEPLNVEGLDVLGVKTCSGATPIGNDFVHCATLNASGWPPTGVATREVADTVIDGTTQNPSVGVLIGLRRQPTASVGIISAVRVVYTVEGVSYEVVQPWSLRLVPAGALESPEATD